MTAWVLAAGEGLSESTVAWVFIDVAIVVVTARLVGALFRRIGQPPVVGEILAGVALGPLLLGSGVVTDFLGLDESLSDTLFPHEARPFLGILAQIGLIIFMFVVGLELDMRLIRGKERLAAGVSITSVMLPFALGIGLAWLLHDSYAAPGFDEFLPFALFVGASMSVTAFPVLARILHERRMQAIPIGAVSLACAAIDDIIAWSLLALVLAVVESATGGGGGNPLLDLSRVIGLTLVFGAVMSLAVRPVLVRLNERVKARGGGMPADVLAAILVILLLASWCTSQIGIHSIFGAFMLGVVFPREGAEELTRALLLRIESLAVVLFLPLFFIVTGLNARMGEGISPLSFLGVLAAVVTVAVVGKFVGAAVAGRIQGMSWRRSAAIGALMNTRGLTELVLLSIGLEKGVLDETLFTALLLMAIITTVMTAPLLRRIYPERMVEHDIAEAERALLDDAIAFRVIVAIDDPERAGPLVDMACDIAMSQQPAEIVLVNLEEQDAADDESELSSSLLAIAGELDAVHRLEEAVRARGLSVQAFSHRTTDLAADVAAQAERLGVGMVLMGDRRDDPEWVSTVGDLVAAGPTDVGVLVAPLPRPGTPERTGAPVVEAGDGEAALAALEYGVRLALPDSGPVLVGVTAAGRGAKRYTAAAETLGTAGHDTRVVGSDLTSDEAQEAAGAAIAIVRPFAGPEGLEPVERARPDAERYGCPVLLVAPDPNRLERSGLDSLLAELEPAPA